MRSRKAPPEKVVVYRLVQIYVSLIFGIVGLFPLGAYFNQNGWPVFHTWGLAHGSFIIAVPVLGFPVFVLLGWLLGLSFRMQPNSSFKGDVPDGPRP